MCFKRLYVKKPQTNQLTNKTPNHHTLKIPENKQTGPTKITPMLVGHNAANNLFTQHRPWFDSTEQEQTLI